MENGSVLLVGFVFVLLVVEYPPVREASLLLADVVELSPPVGYGTVPVVPIAVVELSPPVGYGTIPVVPTEVVELRPPVGYGTVPVEPVPVGVKGVEVEFKPPVG